MKTIQPAEYKAFPPGQAVAHGEFTKGDFILTHGSGWIPNLSRFGQRIRFRGQERKYACWSHVALIADDHGGLIEASHDGVQRSDLSQYLETEYHLVRLPEPIANDHDRNQVCTFAETCLHQEYDFLAPFSIAFSLLTGLRIALYYEGQTMCSGLVARALERTGVIFNRNPAHMLPADLARHFQVEATFSKINIGKPPRRFKRRRK